MVNSNTSLGFLSMCSLENLKGVAGLISARKCGRNWRVHMLKLKVFLESKELCLVRSAQR